MKNKINRVFTAKKNVMIKSLLIAICAIAFVGCPDGYRAPKAELVIKGTITDEAGQPLENILVCVDTALIPVYSVGEDHWYEYARSTTKEGTFTIRYKHNYICPNYDTWPSEVLIIAGDTTGVYEMQTKKFPVEEGEVNTGDGYVTADFVMKKKK